MTFSRIGHDRRLKGRNLNQIEIRFDEPDNLMIFSSFSNYKELGIAKYTLEVLNLHQLMKS